MHEELISAVVTAALVSEGIEMLKRWRAFPFLTRDTAKANQVIGAVAAFLTGLGLAFHYDPVAGTLLIKGLTWSALTHGAKQYVAQQAWFRAFISKNPALQAAVSGDNMSILVNNASKGAGS